MTRFHWHVENGMGAYIPVGGVTAGEGGVQHAMCEIEVQGCSGTLQACLTLPPRYMSEDCIRDTGVLLGHGGEGPLGWQAPLMAELASALAAAGFIVARDATPPWLSEVQRQRAFEKVLDAAATSPYARTVRRWVLGGVGAGARVAAVAGARARSAVAAEVLLAYPLASPMPTIKGSRMPDSCMPLLRVSAPALLVAADGDAACPLPALRSALRAMASHDVRLVVAQGVDGHFAAPSPGQPAAAAAPSAPILGALVAGVAQFIAAVADGDLERCPLQRVKGGPDDSPPTAAGAAALQAAQMRMQEEDALAYQQDPSSMLAAARGEQQAAPAGSGGAAAAEVPAADEQPPPQQRQQDQQQERLEQLGS